MYLRTELYVTATQLIVGNIQLIVTVCTVASGSLARLYATPPAHLSVCARVSPLMSRLYYTTRAHFHVLYLYLPLTSTQGNASGDSSDIATIGTLLYAARVPPPTTTLELLDYIHPSTPPIPLPELTIWQIAGPSVAGGLDRACGVVPFLGSSRYPCFDVAGNPMSDKSKRDVLPPSLSLPPPSQH